MAMAFAERRLGLHIFGVDQAFDHQLGLGGDLQVLGLALHQPDRVFDQPAGDGQLVRAVFDNPDRILTDGQTTRIRIEEETPQQVLSIPLDAVSADQTGSFVLIVNSEEKVERRSVRLGPQDAGFVTVQDGLAEGDRVIVQGQLRVREGVPVEVVAGEDASGQDS